jgi:hypothetical protein
MSRLVGRDGGHRQLSGPDSLRTREPGKADVLDYIGQGLGPKLGVTQSLWHNYSQAAQPETKVQGSKAMRRGKYIVQ